MLFKPAPSSPAFGEAILRYEPGDYSIKQQGTFVRCAITNAPIQLDDLKYWSVEKQEAYSSPEAVLKRFKQA